VTKRKFTDVVLDDEMAEILRAKTAAERLVLMGQLWDFAARVVRDMARAQHPDWTEDELTKHVARRMSHGTA
jgi:hypothetical protein